MTDIFELLKGKPEDSDVQVGAGASSDKVRGRG